MNKFLILLVAGLLLSVTGVIGVDILEYDLTSGTHGGLQPGNAGQDRIATPYICHNETLSTLFLVSRGLVSPTMNFIGYYMNQTPGGEPQVNISSKKIITAANVSTLGDGDFFQFNVSGACTNGETIYYVIEAETIDGTGASITYTTPASGAGNSCIYDAGSWSCVHGWQLYVQIYYDASFLPPDNFTITMSVPIVFNATVDGVNYSTASGTITTALLVNDTTPYDITITNGEYFPKFFPAYNVTVQLSTSLYQAEVYLAAFEKITGDPLSGNFSRNGTNVTGKQNISAGTYNFSFINASYYQMDILYVVPPLFNGTINITGVFDTIVTLAAHNAFTGMSLSNVSGWAFNAAEGYNESFTTAAAPATMNLITGFWNIYLESPDYSISAANYKTRNTTPATELFNFSLYSSNSVLSYIYSEDTGLPIVTNISVTFTGNASETTYYTATGSLLVENLTDGLYTVKFQGGNYTLKSYLITVADRSFQTLNAYLSQSTENVILAFLDYDSGATLEGVGLTMYRLINASWTVVQAKESDISGRVQLQYTPIIKYRFDAVLSGYTTNIFYLDPVIFDSYNVRLNKITTLQDDIDYLGVSISYYPTLFYINRSNSLTWIISSPSGVIEDYNLSITYPGGSGAYSGVNAIGEQFVHPFNITGATMTDRVNITYCYDITLGSDRCFSFAYAIIGVYGNLTFMSNRDNTYGLGLFERILLATLAVLIVAGFLTFLAGPIIGFAVGLLIFGYMSYIGFVSLWAILPSLLVGFVILSRRSSQ